MFQKNLSGGSAAPPAATEPAGDRIGTLLSAIVQVDFYVWRAIVRAHIIFAIIRSPPRNIQLQQEVRLDTYMFIPGSTRLNNRENLCQSSRNSPQCSHELDLWIIPSETKITLMYKHDALHRMSKFVVDVQLNSHFYRPTTTPSFTSLNQISTPTSLKIAKRLGINAGNIFFCKTM